MTRQLRIAVLSGFFLLSSLAMVHSVRAQNAPPPPVPVMDQMTNIPYFTLRDGMSSTLTLNNIGPSSTPVTVTIYNMEGKAQVLDPITLDPHSFKQIELRDVVVSGEFDSGNIEVAFNSIPMGVTCQISVSKLDKRVSFESREQDMMDFNSPKLNGILWLPQRDAEGFLAITNTAKNKVTVDLAVGSKQKTILLYPRETRLLNLSEELGQRPPVAALVKLQHSGLPGDIITTGYVLNLKDGYSSSFAMVDPAIMRSTHLAGAHLRIGKPDPSEGFPEDTQFRSPLLLANISDKPVEAHVSVDYTSKEKAQMTLWRPEDSKEDATDQEAGVSEEESKTSVAKEIMISPGAVQLIELSEELARLGVTGPVEEAGVDIAYDGTPGALIGQLVSVDQSGDDSFEVPIKDPAAITETLESVYPWTIENGTNTVLHLKNTTDHSVNSLVLFNVSDGKTYNPLRIVLKPYQSVAMDIRKLKDSKKPDLLGHVFPDATHGQLQWVQEEPYSMIGRAEETNVSEGIARSFSCGADCCYNFGVYGFHLSPSSLTGDVGGSGSIAAQEDYRMCNGVSVFNQPVSAASLGSDNSSVATVSYGNVSYVGGGTANIGTTFIGMAYEFNFDKCQPVAPADRPRFPVSALVTVNHPAALRVISAAVDPTFCNNGLSGIGLDIHYEVTGDNGAAFRSSAMEPQEKNLNDTLDGVPQGDSLPNWGDIGPTGYPGSSKYTDANGQFWDAPLGVCGNAGHTITFTQPIQVLLNGQGYPVRTNYWTFVLSSPGHGSVTNNNDISGIR